MKFVRAAWRASRNNLVLQIALNVHRQPERSLVSPCAVLLQGLYHNPVQIALQFPDQLRRLSATTLGQTRQIYRDHRTQSGRGKNRFLVADYATNFIQPCFQEFPSVE